MINAPGTGRVAAAVGSALPTPGLFAEPERIAGRASSTAVDVATSQRSTNVDTPGQYGLDAPLDVPAADYHDAVASIRQAFDRRLLLSEHDRLERIAAVVGGPAELNPAADRSTAQQWQAAGARIDSLLADARSSDASIARVAADQIDHAMRIDHGWQAPREAIEAVTALRWTAIERQHGLFALPPRDPSARGAPTMRLELPPEHLPSLPGQRGLDDAPLERAIADARSAGRLIGSRSRTQVERIERTLASGDAHLRADDRTGSGSNNINGALAVRAFAGADGTTLLGITKERSAQAAQEAFAWQLAKRLRLDPIVAPVGRDADGAIHAELRPGRSMQQAGVRGSGQLESHIARGYQARFPLAGTDVADRAARFDAQVMRAFDYLVANSDRHGGNILDAQGRGVTFIDHGLAGKGVVRGGDPLRPRARDFSHPPDGAAVERLDPDVIEHIRRNLDPTEVRPVWNATIGRENRTDATPAGEYRDLARAAFDAVATPRFADEVVARLDFLLATGEIRWHGPRQRSGF